jgi:predicted acylesterase/phospholipase RssA/CRP-like cAMP-binding protein
MTGPVFHDDVLKQLLPGVFGELSDAAFHDILPHLELRELRFREVLFESGDPGDSMYILVSGRLEAYLRGADGAETVIGPVIPGECVGEMGLLTGDVASACVRALRDSVLLRINADNFRTLSHAYPDLLANIARVVVRRLHQSYAVRPKPIGYRTIACVSLSPKLDAERLFARLALQLRTYGTVRIVDVEYFDIDASLRASGESRSFAERLSGLENNADMVLLTCRYDDRKWANRCIRSADKVLLFADATDDPAVGPFEEAALAGLERRALNLDLVLVHEDASRPPTDTARWLDVRDERKHFHVRLKEEGDLARLARFLTGNAVALILGGGGSRGFAHIGVIRAMEELGVHLDLVCGTSMGALIAAGAACEFSGKELFEKGQVLNAHRPFGDFTFPLLSIIKGRRITRLMKQALGDGDIADCWKPFFCVSASLSRADTYIHRRGPLYKAVRASMSLPGVMPPAIDEGELLIDGGIVNNFPVDIVKKEYGCLTIGVSVSVHKELKVPETEVPSIGAHLFKKYIQRAAGYRMPNMVDVILQTTTLASYRKSLEDANLLDVALHPPVSEFGMMDIARYAEIVERGYRYTRENGEMLKRFATKRRSAVRYSSVLNMPVPGER